jgi:uncharacterized protein (TIGR02453 family)
MASRFPGFRPEALKFMRALKRNNDREWFQPRKHAFETHVRNPMLELIAELNRDLMKFAPDYVTDPSKAIFRIYRDTRFSNDKTPYKTHVAAVFSHRAMPRNLGAGYYFQFSTEGLGMGGGIYMPRADILAGIRKAIDADPGSFRRAIRKIESKKIAGEWEMHQLTRVPKGYVADHPAADLLKGRSLFFYSKLPAETIFSPEVGKEIATRFRAVAPLVQILDKAILGAVRSAPKKFTLDDAF